MRGGFLHMNFRLGWQTMIIPIYASYLTGAHDFLLIRSPLEIFSRSASSFFGEGSQVQRTIIMDVLPATLLNHDHTWTTLGWWGDKHVLRLLIELLHSEYYQLFWNYDSIFFDSLSAALSAALQQVLYIPCHKFSFSSGTRNNHQQLCLLWPVLVYRMQHIHGWEFNSHYTPVPCTPTSLVATACLDESCKWTCFLATQNCEGPRDLSLRYIPLLHAQKSQTIKSNIVVLWWYCALFAIHIAAFDSSCWSEWFWMQAIFYLIYFSIFPIF